ncbi:MAG: Gfo/Idh/MocA family oxidoreductase [Acidobacteriota bacterium]|nr:Gfo/Idh/MocA family oxidoreductase [Acidobacteriota bacterium]
MPRTKRRPTSPGRSKQEPRRVRYGVVGLGWFAQTAILPAFAHAKKNSELAALFSESPKKLEALGRKYRVPRERRFSTDDFEEALSASGVDAVYIATPNDLHREFAVRAARSNVHVLCEKPMAVTERDCEEMIAAAVKSGVKLMIAYRLHFERANLEAVEIVNSGKLGEPRIYASVFCNEVKDRDNIRLHPIEKGGGTLYDIGIYCLNAARYLFRGEPVEVVALSANGGNPRFSETDEMTSAILKFPGERLATFTSSFGAASAHFYDVYGTKGRLRVEPAFEFAEGMRHELKIGERKRTKQFAARDQVAPEILSFSECILENREPEPSGREGLADVRVIRALYESARTGRPVRLAPFEKRRRPSLEQEVRRPPNREPELVRVGKPSQR